MANYDHSTINELLNICKSKLNFSADKGIVKNIEIVKLFKETQQLMLPHMNCYWLVPFYLSPKSIVITYNIFLTNANKTQYEPQFGIFHNQKRSVTKTYLTLVK